MHDHGRALTIVHFLPWVSRIMRTRRGSTYDLKGGVHGLPEAAVRGEGGRVATAMEVCRRMETSALRVPNALWAMRLG